GIFTINIMVDGKRIHRVVGKESEGVTRTHAENYIERLRIDAREGRLNLPKGRKVVFGFKDAAKNYIQKLQEENGKDIHKKIKRLQEDKGRIIYLTTQQIEKLLHIAKHDRCPYIFLFILIGLETSMRRMEILSIQIKNIDLVKRVIYIPTAKSGAREQPITQS